MIYYVEYKITKHYKRNQLHYAITLEIAILWRFGVYSDFDTLKRRSSRDLFVFEVSYCRNDA